MITILLVDDHQLFRSGLRTLLSDSNEVEVIGEADDGEQAVQFVRQTVPDVVLMDVNMPGVGGIEATRRLLRVAPSVKVIGVTAHTEAPFPNQLLDAGALGYISKGCPADELLSAIFDVMKGKAVLSADVAQKLALRQVVGSDSPEALQKLSAREMQVMLMIVSGLSTQEISDKLFLSPKTVSTYRHRLYDKIGVNSDVSLTRFAIRHRLIDDV